MRKPRFNLRVLMILIAVVAVIVGGWTMKTRRDRALKLVRQMTMLEQQADLMVKNAEQLEGEAWLARTEYREEQRRLRSYYQRMKLIYLDVASRPWMALPHFEDPRLIAKKTTELNSGERSQ